MLHYPESALLTGLQERVELQGRLFWEAAGGHAGWEVARLGICEIVTWLVIVNDINVMLCLHVQLDASPRVHVVHQPEHNDDV